MLCIALYGQEDLRLEQVRPAPALPVSGNSSGGGDYLWHRSEEVASGAVMPKCYDLLHCLGMGRADCGSGEDVTSWVGDRSGCG